MGQIINRCFGNETRMMIDFLIFRRLADISDLLKTGTHIAKPLTITPVPALHFEQGQNELKTTEILRKNRRYRQPDPGG
jgi:hypothetical protein